MAKESLNLLAFAQRLKELQRQVQGTAGLVKDAAKPVALDQNKVGRLSRIDAMQGQAMAHANAQRQATLLLPIERALDEIQSGEFGRCIQCDEFIASERLMASPVAQMCIACATALEQH